MRLLWTILLAAPAWACSCVNFGATPCNTLWESTAVFVARVITDSGEGWGKGPAHVAIEEALQNVPAGSKEADIETSAGTSCYFRLQKGERYVILTDAGRYAVASCSTSFLLRGKEDILEALRIQIRGGPSRIVGTVSRSTGKYRSEGGLPGVSVTVESGTTTQSTMTDGQGHYTFANLEPGRYKATVSKPGYKPDSEYNERWNGHMTVNSTTNRFEPDKTAKGIVDVGKNRCAVWNLSMWPAGEISGTVRDRNGKPLGGITVQAFGFDEKTNEMDSTPLRTAKSGSDGVYRIESLPAGKFAVGVNAQRWRDEDLYPPSLHGRGEPVYLEESATISGIDLELPAPRTPAVLHVKVLGYDGLPHRGATVSLENLAGVQRYFSRQESDANGEITIPCYVGEQYVVRGSHYAILEPRRMEHFAGSSQIQVDSADSFVTVKLQLAPLRQ